MAFQFKQGDRPLAGYTIQRGVGRGGFGEVYYATSDGGKEVALKFLRENPQIELRGVSHCLNLKSPYLVGIHDVKQNDDGDYFVIMEYVNGPSLRDLMNNEPNGLGTQKAAYFLREIGKGLAYLHDRGIVHRDLKPGNIFYEDGYVKIGDYGLAKIMAASQHSGQTMSVGTVHYMAPEVGSGNYDRTIDIYALGVILYEMLLGRVPFAGATMGEVLMKHLTAQPEVDELPAPFPHVIRKALTKDPKDRYQTVNEMVSEIFSIPALDQSVAAFEPASLSAAAARAAQHVNVGAGGNPLGATMTVGTGSSNVGQGGWMPASAIPGMGGERRDRFGGVPFRGADVVIGRRGKIERVADRIDRTALAQQLNQTVSTPGNHVIRVIVAIMIAAGVSLGVSLITGHRFGHGPFFAGFVFLNIVSVVQGVLIGTWLSYERLKIAGIWIPRAIITSFASVGLLATVSLNGPNIAGAMIVCLLVCDWAGRFYQGRLGRMSLGSAFSVGLFAFLCGIIFANGAGLTLAAIAAAASLVVQAVGSLWPLAPGAVVPRTRGDQKEDDCHRSVPLESPQTPAPVAVEPRGFAMPGFRGGEGLSGPKTPSGPQSPAMLDQNHAETDGRIRRSSVVRSFWLLLSAFALCGSVVLFAAPHIMDSSRVIDGKKVYVPLVGENADEDVGLFTMWGTAVGCLFLFLFTRSWSGYKTGLWRGLLRPAVFFGGLALSACCGIAMGLLKLPGEAPPFLLGGILFGAVSSLFVWFVPVSPYRPRGRSDSLINKDGSIHEHEEARQLAGQRFRTAGFTTLAVMVGIMAIVGSSTHGRDAEEAIPPIAVIGSLIATAFFVTARRRSRPQKVKVVEKLSLPLRRVFEIDANPNLGKLIERHLSMFGYRLVSKSDLLWSFERGNWAHQFWQKDVRQWKLKFNIAAYELDTGGLRITCYVDMDGAFQEPKPNQLAILDSEIQDLKGLLGGRDAPSGATPLTA